MESDGHDVGGSGNCCGRMLNYNDMNYDINFNAATFINVTCNVPVITLRL